MLKKKVCNMNVPLGTSNFKDIIENQLYYVDKTPFLEKVLGKGARVSLITRPRRFGKTLMLDMVSTFLDINHAEENRRLFQGLSIEKNNFIMDNYQGKIPVINISLKNCQEETFEKFCNSLAVEMRRVVCDDFTELTTEPNLHKALLSDLDSILAKNTDSQNLSDSLLNLTRIISMHYSRKPAVFIDEYDSPINNVAFATLEDKRKTLQLIGKFMGKALKDNRNLAFSIITGIHRITKENIFSGLNNLYISNVQNGVFAEDFGFTSIEVVEMLRAFDLQKSIEQAMEWYDGYRFGSMEIYNPWSIMNFVDSEGRAEAYWRNMSKNSIVKDFLSDSDNIDLIMELYQGKEIETFLDDGFTMDEATNKEKLLSLMVSTGYLKTARKLENGNYMLCIPNKEIRTIFKDEILDWCIPKKKNLCNKIMQAIQKGKENETESILKEILKEMASYYDTSSEAFYHGMVLGLLTEGNDMFEIKSNREAGDGRFDICMSPRNKKKNIPGILLEFKKSKNKASLALDAKKAIKQIKAKGYISELEANKVKEKWLYGISFFKSDVYVKVEKIPPYGPS